jgi:hypothetical protein
MSSFDELLIEIRATHRNMSDFTNEILNKLFIHCVGVGYISQIFNNQHGMENVKTFAT